MNESITRAQRSIERELKHAEEHVAKLKAALRSMQALNGTGKGVRLVGKRDKSKGLLLTCQTKGCGTVFRAFRKDAKWCSGCRETRRGEWNVAEKKRKAKARKAGTTLVKGAR